MPSPSRSAAHLACALAAAALAACSHSREVHHHAPSYDFWELEPNDSHCCPDDLGWISVGDSFVLGGSIRDDGLDPFDGFRLTTTGPCAIRFELEALSGWSDLDLCVWDPLIGDFAFCFQSAGALERGVFDVPYSGGDFHLVVASYSGDSEYRLRVECAPIGLGLLESPAEPDGAHPRALFDGYRPAPAAELEPEAVEPRRAWLMVVDPASGEFAVHDALYLPAAREFE